MGGAAMRCWLVGAAADGVPGCVSVGEDVDGFLHRVPSTGRGCGVKNGV